MGAVLNASVPLASHDLVSENSHTYKAADDHEGRNEEIFDGVQHVCICVVMLCSKIYRVEAPKSNTRRLEILSLTVFTHIDVLKTVMSLMTNLYRPLLGLGTCVYL